MCDYSLFQFPNRLARDGEEVIACRFSSGSIGFVPAAEFAGTDLTCGPSGPRKNWPSLKGWFFPRCAHGTQTAICIPPGASLRLFSFTMDFREEYALNSSEEVQFVQLSSDEFAHRDALQFRNGRQISLQKLLPGQRAEVISTSGLPDFASASKVTLTRGRE